MLSCVGSCCLYSSFPLSFFFFFFLCFFVFFLFLFFFFKLLFILFIYFWLCWVFVSVRGLSPAAASGGHSPSRCAGLSPSRPLLLPVRLQTRRLSSCGSRAQLLRGTWDPPRPGLEPVCPASAGRLSTTAPPGKPRFLFLDLLFHFGGTPLHSLWDRTRPPGSGQGSNLCPLQWKHRVLTTGPPGKSPVWCFLKNNSYISTF